MEQMTEENGAQTLNDQPKKPAAKARRAETAAAKPEKRAAAGRR